MGTLIEHRRRLMGSTVAPIPIVWDANSTGKYIGANGNIGNSANFHYSSLLPCQTAIFNYKFSFSGATTDRRTRIHGYDAGGNWVRQLVYELTYNGDYAMPFTVTNDIKYIRISNGIQATNESIVPKGY